MSFFLADIGGQTGFVDRFAERFKFLLLTFDGHFYASIGQIADRTGDFKSSGQGPDRITETDPLDATRIQDLHPAALCWR